MKKLLLAVFGIFLLSNQLAFAYYDLGIQYELRQNYLESQKLGASAVLSNALTLWDKNQPTIAVKYLIAENSEKSAAFLPLIKNQFDFGAGLKLNEQYLLKFAATQLNENSATLPAERKFSDGSSQSSQKTSQKAEQKNFSAYGIYFNRYGKMFKKTELATESDSKGKNLYYGYGRITLLQNADILTGFSIESSDESFSRRFGAAIAPALKSYSLIFGLTRNLNEGNNAKLYGLAYSAGENSEMPSFLAIFRDKPESKYFLGIIVFGNKTLNQYSYQGIYNTMFSGSLSGTRVIANRNFDQIGVSNLYKTSDYGKLAITASVGEIKISDVNSLFFDYEEVVYNFSGNGKSIKSWLASFGHNGNTNLVFNTKTRSLNEDYQQELILGIGAKFLNKDKNNFDLNLKNSYNLNQSEWSGVSAMVNFYF